MVRQRTASVEPVWRVDIQSDILKAKQTAPNRNSKIILKVPLRQQPCSSSLSQATTAVEFGPFEFEGFSLLCQSVQQRSSLSFEAGREFCVLVYLCEHIQVKVECLPHWAPPLFVEAGSVAEPRALESQLSLATQPALGIPLVLLSGPGITENHHTCLAFVCGVNVGFSCLHSKRCVSPYIRKIKFS